ncbi:hypothetical protein [Clostridium tetanomorphum]|uniref:hypothetical protein n=1 Tax=Clostridium tetanomorphum TaxID=1553 RepID=UPI000D8DB6D0|nr:hypothetical protein [Clostridium tetanomorphum]SQB91646.1 Uncharacterised protein [Clostridium tetanomorphum]
MGFFRKVNSLNSIVFSKIKENVQRGYLNSKAKRIEKEIISLEKKEVLQLKNKKENIQLKIEEVKIRKK